MLCNKKARVERAFLLCYFLGGLGGAGGAVGAVGGGGGAIATDAWSTT